MKALQVLGCEATDKVSGLVGVVTSVSFDLIGCIQGYVAPKMDKDGKLPDGRWFDVARLEIGKRVMPAVFDEQGNLIADGKGASEKSAPSQR